MKKFSIRDLFWLVLVVAILCGWWLEHRKTVRLRNEIAQSERAMRNVVIDLTGTQPSPGSFYIGFSR